MQCSSYVLLERGEGAIDYKHKEARQTWDIRHMLEPIIVLGLKPVIRHATRLSVIARIANLLKTLQFLPSSMRGRLTSRRQGERGNTPGT